MQAAQQRPYRNIGFFFLLLLVLVVAGFTPAVPGTPFFGYFGQLGGTRHVPASIHLHAAIALAWFVLLALQPFLMRANRVALHKVLGWASIAIVLLFTGTAIAVMQHFYAQAITQMPRDTVLSLLAQSFSALSLLLICYTTALLRRRRIHQHVAFLVGAALATATPGLARLGLFAVGGMPGILLVVAMIYATLIGFMLLAKLRYRQPIRRSPYLIIIALFLLAHALDFVGSQTRTWRWLAGQVVANW